MTQLSFANTLRDSSLSRVWQNAPDDYRVLARRVVRTMHGQEVTGEDIRQRCEQLDIKPHHHNAWGSLIMQLVKSGWLIPTDKYVPMQGIKSNGRKTQVYLVRAQ